MQEIKHTDRTTMNKTEKLGELMRTVKYRLKIFKNSWCNWQDTVRPNRILESYTILLNSGEYKIIMVEYRWKDREWEYYVYELTTIM